MLNSLKKIFKFSKNSLILIKFHFNYKKLCYLYKFAKLNKKIIYNR